MLGLTEQRILVLLSSLKKNDNFEVNATNKLMGEKFDKTQVHISNSLQKLERGGYISINRKRGTGRRIIVLKPQDRIK